MRLVLCRGLSKVHRFVIAVGLGARRQALIGGPLDSVLFVLLELVRGEFLRTSASLVSYGCRTESKKPLVQFLFLNLSSFLDLSPGVSFKGISSRC